MLPGVDKRRRALLGAVAWAKGRGNPGDTEPQAPPYLLAPHLLLSYVKHHLGWWGSPLQEPEGTGPLKEPQGQPVQAALE